MFTWVGWCTVVLLYNSRMYFCIVGFYITNAIRKSKHWCSLVYGLFLDNVVHAR